MRRATQTPLLGLDVAAVVGGHDHVHGNAGAPGKRRWRGRDVALWLGALSALWLALLATALVVAGVRLGRDAAAGVHEARARWEATWRPQLEAQARAATLVVERLQARAAALEAAVDAALEEARAGDAAGQARAAARTASIWGARLEALWWDQRVAVLARAGGDAAALLEARGSDLVDDLQQALNTTRALVRRAAQRMRVFEEALLN